MIHIATNHFRDDRWIELQLRYLESHTREPYRVYAAVEGIEERQRSRLHHAPGYGSRVDPESGKGLSQGAWLTLLAEEIARQADPDDLLVFMHGDAFPIADWVGPVREMLAQSSLAAVRRDENMEPTAHECFCATTVGFWTEIGGRWSTGPTWESDGRRVTDTSASLWQELERRGVNWHPILRTNATNPHPVWFGIYGDIVYHHGGGFRTPMSRRDAAAYSHLPVPLRNFAGVRRRISNSVLSRRMYRRIQEDERFHHALMGERTA